MKRCLSRSFIVGYLLLLGYGFVSHTFQYKHNDHLGMYFIVWDMFCGWDAFEMRKHLIAEGESGQYYDLSAPWKEFNPYLEAERRHFDSWGFFSGYLGANTLKQTDHEPIVRMYLVEEHWSKKYNLPDPLWSKRFDEPKQKRSYYYMRCEFDEQGTLSGMHYSWPNQLAYRALMNNPRLKEDVAKSQPYMDATKFFGIQPVAHALSATP